MTRIAIPVQLTTRDGVIATTTAADMTNNHEFDNASQNVLINVINGDASPVNATFITPGDVDEQPIADRVVAVAAGTDQWIGPFKNAQYGTGTASNVVQIDLDNETAISLSALRPGSL